MATAARNTQREKVTFRTGVPVQIELASTGEPQPSSYSGAMEYRYFLTGDQVMWLPEEPHAQIKRLGMREGSIVTITRTKAGPWLVKPTEDLWAEPAAPAKPAAAKPAATKPPAPQPPTAQPDFEQPFSLAYYTALCAALRIAAAAELFAQQIQRPCAFRTEDIRAIAATLYINAEAK